MIKRLEHAAFAAALTAPAIALAHHPMGGATPSNLFEGLASGLAHPIIGLDHLLFVLAIGAACYCFSRGAGTVAAFLGAALTGTLVHASGATLPYAEAWVAASLVICGGLILRAPRVLKSRAAIGFFALAGLVHGYAYGEAIVGAEQTPLVAYFVGFTVIQIAIVAAGYALARFLDRRRAAPAAATAFGSALSIAGTAFLVLALV